MSENSNMNTRDKIMLAAIDIMSEKGYAATTTKEIALGAGVNEVTLFRHFGTKEGLVKAAFSRFHYGDEMTKLFENRLVGELETDLLVISQHYHKLMSGNRKLFMITQRGRGQLPDEVYEEAHRHPMQLKKLLTDYLGNMMSQGQIVATERSDLRAWSFMWMHHGAFLSQLNEDDLSVFITDSVNLFVRGLRPDTE
ncbi:TetR/AcrR family transcriptional regulator [Paenibacillus sp. strain BS8-2]